LSQNSGGKGKNWLQIRPMLLYSNDSRSYHAFNGSIGLKNDTAPFVMMLHSSVRFHQNPMKKLVENAVKTRFEVDF